MRLYTIHIHIRVGAGLAARVASLAVRLVAPRIVAGPAPRAAPESAIVLADVRLQALAEIARAHDRHDESDEQQDYGDDGEDGERFACGEVVGAPGAVGVHAHELENEVGEGGKVEELVRTVSRCPN